MKVSIITVCYNAENTIERTINSVLSQNYTKIEYIVIDGASSDNTIQIINKYIDKIAIFKSEKDKGIYDAMNKGLDLATGDLIGFLNADDYFAQRTSITRMINHLKKSKAEAIYSDLKYVKGKQTIRTWVSGKYNRNNFLHGWMPPHPTFYTTKSNYNSFGGFNIDFKIGADYELMLRFLFKHKISCTYFPKTTILMEVGGESNKNINARQKAIKETKKAWMVNRLAMPFYLPYFKPMRKVFQFFKT